MLTQGDLERLLKPIRFASKDQFKNLERVRELGRTLAQVARDLALPGELVALCERLDALPIAERKRGLLEVLQRVEALAGGSATATPTATSTATSTRTDGAETLLRYLKGVGETTAAALAQRNLYTVRDLLYFLPRRYEDRRLRTTIREAPVGERIMITATIKVLGQVPTRGGRRLFEMAVADGSGVLRLKWFRFSLKHFQKSFAPGMEVAVSGVVELYQGQKQILHPDLQIVRDAESLADLPPIIPHYLEIEGVHPKRLRSIVAAALPFADRLPDLLAAGLFPERPLPSLADALRALHTPSEGADIALLTSGRSPWHERLILEELLLLQLGLGKRRLQASFEAGIVLNQPVETAIFPFALTAAQQRVLQEIAQDLKSGRPMHRLVQGDVGSGKTAVAFLAMLAAVRAGHQAALMAPTELLAEQHWKNAVKFLHPHGARLGFLSSSVTQSEAKKLLAQVEAGAIDVLIGTHALIQERVAFRSLALAIVDEQHRFGVVQRAKLRAKGRNGVPPHLLVMTATPIPRTLALTVYGDLDLSIIDELPPGRTPVKTELVRDTQRSALYKKLEKQLAAGRQVYVVYPLVEESDKLELKDATKMAAELRQQFPAYTVDLLHGRMSADDKDAVMRRFLSRDAQLLVATTVIEVGIDVPNATVMVIEHADRFGLSQLHQLRGRVGRGAHQSYCYLVCAFAGEEAYRRLRVLCDTQDGFRIAEEDLAIRGPGDFIGTRQAGLPELGVSNLARDQDLLIAARREADRLLSVDAELGAYPALSAAVRDTFARAEQLAVTG